MHVCSQTYNSIFPIHRKLNLQELCYVIHLNRANIPLELPIPLSGENQHLLSCDTFWHKDHAFMAFDHTDTGSL